MLECFGFHCKDVSQNSHSKAEGGKWKDKQAQRELKNLQDASQITKQLQDVVNFTLMLGY